MAIDKPTLLALADTLLAAESSLASLIAACHRVFGASQPWAPAVCAALIARTGDNFHDFNRHEIADILLQLLVAAEQQDEPAPPGIALPPVRRYCTEKIKNRKLRLHRKTE